MPMKSPEYSRNISTFPDYLKPFIDKNDELVKVSSSVFGMFSKIKEQLNDAENKSRTLLIVSGFSGAGKDTLVKELIDQDKRFGWVKTCTTREIRPEEVDCDPYIRLTEEEYDKASKGGDVVETNGYPGGRYLSLNSTFLEVMNNFEYPILRIDPRGSRFYQNLWKESLWLFDKMNLIYVFLATPSPEILRERLEKRGDKPADVEKRMKQLLPDLPFVSDAEYIAINETDRLDEVAQNILKLFPKDSI